MAKRNKMLRKVLVAMCSAVLLVGATVGVTMAYLQSKTEVVTNTFTVGKVNITLDEAAVNVYGETESANPRRVTANSYKLIPGHEYTKDPTIHVAEGSEKCYLFVKVTNDITTIEAVPTIATQMTKTNGWKQLVVDDETITNVYYLEDPIDARTEAQDVQVFGSFKLSDEVDYNGIEDYLNKTIKVQAYAVQSDGFDTAVDAWKSASTTWNN